MRDYRIGREQIDRYAAHLRREERSPGTVENYLRHARTFATWLNGRPVTRERAAEWKERLRVLGGDQATPYFRRGLAAFDRL